MHHLVGAGAVRKPLDEGGEEPSHCAATSCFGLRGLRAHRLDATCWQLPEWKAVAVLSRCFTHKVTLPSQEEEVAHLGYDLVSVHAQRATGVTESGIADQLSSIVLSAEVLVAAPTSLERSAAFPGESSR